MEHTETLANMAESRVNALRAAAARDIALRILEANGTVSAEEVAAALDEEFTPPDPNVLMGQMVQKAHAAVEQHRYVADRESARYAGLAAKVAKYEKLLADAKSGLANFESSAEVDLHDAVELADFLESAVS
jgi:hypothetical protein